jgi:hypothetical protein
MKHNLMKLLDIVVQGVKLGVPWLITTTTTQLIIKDNGMYRKAFKSLKGF